MALSYSIRAISFIDEQWCCVQSSCYVLCKIGVSGDIDMILFGSALWCCGQFVQICLLMNGYVVDNIRISPIGKWHYRIPSVRFHSVANANGVLNPIGVEHTINGYHRTNIWWLNVAPSFIIRQNHGERHTIGGYHRTNTSWLNAISPFIIRQKHGVRHTMGSYHRTNISWLNATSPFTVRQNHGLGEHYQCYHKLKSHIEVATSWFVTQQ